LAFAAGRIGSVLGPVVGAILIGLELPLPLLLLAMAGPVLLGGLAALMLALLSRRRFGTWSIDENPHGEAARAS
jgi:AAHS family 4-hydroxybenzoate transporter-like MFS transporter